MIEKTGVGNAGGKVGGVGQRGELIADISTGDDHTGSDGGIHTETCADTDEGKADGRGGGPGGAAGETDDGAHNAADGKECLRAQELQTVVNQSGDGAGSHEGGYQETDRAEDQDRFEGCAQTLDHTGENVGELVSADTADDRGDRDGNDQRHMCINIETIEVQAVDHQTHHHDDGDQCLDHTGSSYLLFFCHFENTSLSLKNRCF